ncbi:MAG TPA: hypothetical protein PKL97_00510 [Candidatus Omnitrophota bacterium]|nr:hypothetical protein [Candidatus Omnitrophota bacterium]
MSFRKKILYLVIVVSVSFALCEVLLRLFPRVLEKSPSNQQTAIPQLISDPVLEFRPNPAFPGHDRLGFRNESVPERASIVATGDSQTYGVGVGREDAWPQRVAEIGGWSVYNMASSGWGPAHSLTRMDEALKFKPKMIVEAFYAGNDLYDSFNLVYYFGQLPGLKSSDENVLREIERLEKRKQLRKRATDLFNEVKMKGREIPSGSEAFFLKNFKTYAFWRETVEKIFVSRRDPGGIGRDFFKSRVPSDPAFWPFALNDSCRTIFTPEYRLCGLDFKDVRIVEGLRISLEALRLMDEKARAGGAGFLVLLVPTKESVFEDAVERAQSRRPDTYDRLIGNEKELWRETKEFLRAQNILFLDLLPVLRKNLKNGKQPYPMTWDGHPNQAGQKAIAKVVCSSIRKNGRMSPQKNEEAA